MVESWETCAVGRALGASALLPAWGQRRSLSWRVRILE
jgi:hypothetical protein